MKIVRSICLWVLAIAITLVVAHYQRTTGPTYPYDGKATLGNTPFSFTLLHAYQSGKDQPVLIDLADTNITAVVRWKRYRFDEPWQLLPMDRKSLTPEKIAELSSEGHSLISNSGKVEGQTRSVLLAYLPTQPPAGKLEFMVIIRRGNETVTIPTTGKAEVTRFKGFVPYRILIPHVLCMFFGLLFGMRVLIGAILKEPLRFRALTALIFLTIGGLILGPFVQKYAFGAFWTGWPFGGDMTDNKTALMVIAWAWAWWESHKQFGTRARIAALVAVVVMMIVFLIPHSMRGSEFDYSKMKVETGKREVGTVNK